MSDDTLIETVEHKGFKIEVHSDFDPANPRKEWDNACHMVCWHRRYDLGDEMPREDPDEWLRDHLASIKAGYREGDRKTRNKPCLDDLNRTELVERYRIYGLIQPLYLYDHSGISISMGSFIGRAQHAAWDSGQVGWIYISNDEIVHEWMGDNISCPITDEAMQHARDCMKAEVQVYDDYLTGSVYGYVIKDPDDEQGVSGLFAKYAREGVETTLICSTRGEAGEIAPGVNADSNNLGTVREDELRCAAEKIGISNVYFLDYRDSGMMGTSENADPRCLWQCNLMQVAEKVVRLVRRHQPQVMLTFDPQGGYGHPDHIRAHQAATIAYYVAGDARIFPEHALEGLTPWAPSKLYWGAFPRSRFQKYVEMAEQMGADISVPLREFVKRGISDECVTTRIQVAEYVDLKLNALFCHASQMDPNSIWSKIPPEVRREGLKVETLICAESRVGAVQGIEEDIYAGIDGSV